MYTKKRSTDFNILLIEDNPDDADLFQELVSLPGRERHHIVHADTLQKGLKLLRQQPFDIVILDFNLPDVINTSGLDAIVHDYPLIPVVVLTVTVDLLMAQKVLQHGAEEYLIKGEFNRAQLFTCLQSAVLRHQYGCSLRDEADKLTGLAREYTLQLRDSEVKFQAICDSAKDAIFLINSENTFTYWNNGAKTIFGYTGEELHDKELSVLFTPVGDKRLPTNSFQWFHTLTNSKNFQDLAVVNGYRKSGEKIPLELSLTPIELNSEQHLLCIARDITFRVSQESKLNRSKAAFRAVVEESKDGIMVVDGDSTIVFANRAACSLFESEKDGLVGTHFSFPISLEQGTEIQLNSSEGHKTANMMAAKTEWDNSPAYTLTFRDITEYKNLINKLEKALDEIRVLKGIIPICSYCKNIRDDQGIWTRIEQYLANHNPDIFFSHGICEDCMTKHYPEESQELKTWIPGVSENDE